VLFIYNLLILGKNFDEVKKVKLAFLKEFEMKDLGELEICSRV
jgi:hypothetical protein